MGYAVLHTEKGKSSSGGIGNHIDRVKGKEHTYRHADPNRLQLNQNYEVPNNRHKMKLSEAIQDRLDSGYNGKRKIRTDAVKYVTHILTGSHEDMIDIFNHPEKKEQWINENYKFICSEFGEENIVRFTLHLDEKTPHIHAITIPLTADGRLSAREVLGNPKAFESRQDRYAEAMKSFGLKRGISKTGIKHEGAKEYYKRLNATKENEIKTPKSILGIYKPNDVREQTKTLKTLKNELKQVNREKEINKLKITALSRKLEKAKREKNDQAKTLENALQKIEKKEKAIIQIVNLIKDNPEIEEQLSEKFREKNLREKEEKKTRKEQNHPHQNKPKNGLKR